MVAQKIYVLEFKARDFQFRCIYSSGSLWLSVDFFAEGLSVAHLVESIKIVDITGSLTNEVSFKVADVKLSVQAYRLYGRDNLKQSRKSTHRKGEEEKSEDEPTLSQATTTILPSKDLDGLWDSYASICSQMDCQKANPTLG